MIAGGGWRWRSANIIGRTASGGEMTGRSIVLFALAALRGREGAGELVDYASLTNVPAWLDRGLARPAVQRAFEQEGWGGFRFGGRRWRRRRSWTKRWCCAACWSASRSRPKRST